MNKILLHLLAIILLLSACGGNRVSERLNDIDSLVAKEHYDSAYVLLGGLSELSMIENDKAHYQLLSTQLGYLTNKPLPSDSLLDLAITYYNKIENDQKLADAYYYKSYRCEIVGDYANAILYCKNAESRASGLNDMRLKYKIEESLAYLNGLCGNNLLQVKYAKKALKIAEDIDKKLWIVNCLNIISFAFANLSRYDSALYYVDKSIPYVNYVHKSGKAQFFTNVGLLFKSQNRKKAKEYFEKALSYEELPSTIEHLADVYYAEGNKKKAYDLWKKALVKNGEIGYVKANLIHSILAYDIESGRFEDVCNNMDEIIEIQDSIITKVKNDTIKDLQLRFDHEVVMHDADKKLITTQRVAMGLALLLILMAFYIYFRKRREEMIQKELQMQLYAYTTEINQLKEAKENSIAQIKDFESDTDKYSRKIIELEENVKNADIAIKELNKSIKKLLDNEAPKLKLGRELYDSIMSGGTAVEWHSKEEDLFNNYYSCVNYSGYIKLKKVKRKSNLSPHNLFYLILKDMGKSDDEIRRIMALSPEGLRSLRNRTKPI